MGIKHRLADVYAHVPPLKCKGLCQDTCGPVPATVGEIQVIERGGRAFGWDLQSGRCTFFDASTGRCTCYRDRPLICRAWGAVQNMACPYGCEPDRWMTPSQFETLAERVASVAGRSIEPVACVDGRPATWEERQRATREADLLLQRGLRLPDYWDPALPYFICPDCEWRGQTAAGIGPDAFVGTSCPKCHAGVLRLARPGDKRLFVSGAR